jgi:hypothetical protein
MYINGCNDDEDQRVLIPDGSNDSDIQPPRDATILVLRDDCVSDTFGAARKLRELIVDGKPAEFYEFHLEKRSRVRLPHSGRVACVKLDRGLPKAEDAEFVPNLVDPDTIAEIVISGGTLKAVSARSLAGTPIVEWTVDDDGKRQVTITATILDAKREPTKDEQTLTVKNDAAVIFAHSSDLFAEAKQNGWADVSGDGGNGGGWGGPPTWDSKVGKGDYEAVKLYSKIAKNPIDPEKFAYHAKVNEPQDDIPDHEQPAVLKGLKPRNGWPEANPPWCCPNKNPHHGPPHP